MKAFYFSLILSLTSHLASAQLDPNSKNALAVEIIPMAIMVGTGNGLTIGYQRQLQKRTNLKITYGILSDYVDGSFEIPPLVNGEPIAPYTNHVDFESPESYPIQVPDISEFIYLNEMGIKHYKPKKTHRLNHFVNVEAGLNFQLMEKVQLNSSFGFSFGLANRKYNTGAYNLEIGPYGQMWLIISMHSRYLYWGLVQSNQLSYQISDRFSLGISTGLNPIMAKNLFPLDDFVFHLGLLTKVSF